MSKNLKKFLNIVLKPKELVVIFKGTLLDKQSTPELPQESPWLSNIAIDTIILFKFR